MNKENEKIEEMLSRISFRKLSGEEQDFVWQGIIHKQTPLLAILTTKKIMFTSLIVALVLALGVGGTVVTADNAGPGDALFGVDQAIEHLRIRLAGEEKKNELRIRFADERVKELERIRPNEQNNADNKSNFSEEDQTRVTLGISSALNLLNGVSASLDDDSAAELKGITDELNDYLNTLPDDGSTEVDVKSNNNKTRIDLRNEDGRVRVEIKDGKFKIEAKENDDNQNDGGDDDSQTDSSSDDSVNGKLEIEADIFTNETIVKVELNDKKSSFTTSADTKAEIIDAVKEKYPSLTTAEIETALQIETEDRDSLIKDLIGGSLLSPSGDDGDDEEIGDDSNGDDSSEDDSSKDSNDDNSGKGGGHGGDDVDDDD